MRLGARLPGKVSSTEKSGAELKSERFQREDSRGQKGKSTGKGDGGVRSQDKAILLLSARATAKRLPQITGAEGRANKNDFPIRLETQNPGREGSDKT